MTITQTGSGTLTGAGTATSGSYTLSGTADQVTSALQAISFMPSSGAANTSHTTSFTLADQSSAFATPTNGGTVAVTDIDPGVAPTISGVVASQSTTLEAPVLLFSGVTVTDTNGGATETVTITQTGPGTLTGSGLVSSAGSYTLSGTAAQVTAALDALSFTPTAGAANQTRTTSFTLSDKSTAFATPVNGGTVTVADTAPPALIISSFMLVSSGIVSGAAVVTQDGGLEVVSGAVALDTVVSSGAFMEADHGGIESNTVVSSGGYDEIGFGGVAIGTVVSAGGFELVSSGVTTGTTVSSGGVEQVVQGGVVSATAVSAGGAEVVLSGGITSGTMVGSGGTELLYQGAVASGTVVSSGGFLVVLGGTATSATVLSGGTVISSGVVVLDGNTQAVLASFPSSAAGLVTDSGQSIYVLASGVAMGATISGQGGMIVLSGGVASGTTVISGVAENVSAGGIASATSVGADAYENVASGGIVYGTMVSSGGYETVSSGGVAVGTTVSAGGSQFIYSAGAASGTVVKSGGVEVVYQSGLASGTVVSAGGTVRVRNGGVASGTVVSSGGIALISSGGSATATSVGDGATIDLRGLAFVSGGAAVVDITSGLVTAVEGTTSATLTLAGDLSGTSFAMIADGLGGTDLVATVVACFAEGTRIAGPTGPVAVEHLRVGDRVRTHDGRDEAVVWVGHRHVVNPDHDDRPIRVRAHAFAPNRPARDLYLSREHALFFDHVLIPVWCLVDGLAVAPVAVDEVTYFHIQLSRHEILLAEGMPAESLLDNELPHRFDNALSAPVQPVFLEPCAPIIRQGVYLEHIRRYLAGFASRRVGGGEAVLEQMFAGSFARPEAQQQIDHAGAEVAMRDLDG